MIPSFYSLAGSWFFLLLIPLILFYFLKLKRPRIEIPSLVLWQQILQDSRVNSPFQRFRKHFLLLLQILLLCCAVIALMQPFTRGKDSSVNIPILIDVSASMGAETENGTTVLEEAKKEAGNLISGLLPGQKACIITFGSSARKRTPFTDNRKILMDELDRISVRHVESDTENVLRLVQALAQNNAVDRVRLFSDGNIPPQAGFDLPFYIDYQKVGSPLMNMGISALSAQRSGEMSWALLVKLSGSADAAGTGTVRVLQDGAETASEIFSMKGGGEIDMIFDMESSRASSVTVRLEVNGRDSIAADNTAYIELPALRPLSVYVSENLHVFRRALEPMKGVVLFSTDDGTGAFDLAISDKTGNPDVRALTRFFVGVIPDALESNISISNEADEVVDWNRHDPVLKYVSFSDLMILKRPKTAEGFGESGYENYGFSILVHGTEGPFLLKRDEAGTSEYYMLFDPLESTLPYRVAFPVMISNLVSLTRRNAGLAEVEGIRTGVLPDFTFREGDRITVTDPSGKKTEFGPLENGILSGVSAPETGEYLLEVNGTAAGKVGAGLLSGRETAMKSVHTLEFGEGLTVEASENEASTDRSLWPMAAMITFLFMLAEWWYFHKPSIGGA